jgi:hypothetical protein
MEMSLITLHPSNLGWKKLVEDLMGRKVKNPTASWRVSWLFPMNWGNFRNLIP